jgi:TadE-like protein
VSDPSPVASHRWQILGRRAGFTPLAGRGPSPRRASESGQATVELAMCLPMLMLFLLAVVQIAVIVRDQLAVTHLAREGARAAAVSSSPGADARAAIADASSIETAVSVSVHANLVTVSVQHLTRTDVPLIGRLLPDLPVSARATMRLEP